MMHKTDNYIVIQATSIKDLEEYVNRYIRKDYIPQGSLTTCFDGNPKYMYYMQAMIKKEIK